MKNISRRVFIKGMAVAAVATAASTVLTGCKLPAIGGGVDEPVDAPVGQTITLKHIDDPDQVAAVTINGCTVNSQTGLATLSVKVANDTDQELTVTNAEATGETEIGFVVKVFSSQNPKGMAAALTAAGVLSWADYKNLLGEKIAPNGTVTAGASSKEGKLYFTPTTADADWTKAEVTVSLKDATTVSSYTFTVNR